MFKNITWPSAAGLGTAAVLLVVVALEKGLGVDVPGVELTQDWFTVLLTSLGLGAASVVASK